MKKKLLIIPLLILVFSSFAQSGNYVFSGAEAVNFGTIDLATPGAQTWSTFRGAIPGYFSAVGIATYTSPSDANNVNGYVKKYGNTAFTFPVGTGTDLRTIGISAPVNATDAFSTAWILGDPTITPDPSDAAVHPVTSLQAGLYAVQTTGQWDWLTNNGSSAGLIATASIPNAASFAPANTLRLVGWNGTQWVNLSASQGAAAASGNIENSTLTGTLQSGITAVGIGRVFIVVNIKVFLQGPYNAGTGLMSTTLRTNNLIPLTQPYSIAPWNYSGTETVASIPANVTDWILVELRNASNVLVDRRAAFLKNDGTIVDTDGTSSVRFINQPEGNYHIAILHRNHLTIRTPVVTAVNPSMIQYNSTTSQAQAYQNGAITSNTAMRLSGSVYAMWGGNAANTGGGQNILRSTGSPAVNDLQNLLTTLGSNTILSGYYNADLNMDGAVRATGAPTVNDLSLLLNVLGSQVQFTAHQ